MSYTVSSINEAWTKANDIFPTDYMQDSEASANAGYPVYWSTADGVNAWISDLGDRLEVNLPDGKSVNVWIQEPETVEILDVVAEKISETSYIVRTANGSTTTVNTDIEHDGETWPYQIDGQFFSRWDWAKRYLHRRMQEKETGIRYIPRRHQVPEICGVDGRACRNHKCNSALCSCCPIAEKHDADRDGVKIVYLQ